MPLIQRASALIQTKVVLVQLSKSCSTCTGNSVCMAIVQRSYYGQQHSIQAGMVCSLLNYVPHNKHKPPKTALDLNSKSCIASLFFGLGVGFFLFFQENNY